ncbi:DUF1636 family protein [Pelagovum sp. HNIBRBA483]|uniref:DUF1636 family protein n=1 Tax=Pelagovum sp. HNIBRBA483 TaxID=3233341 RepID=UPI0034A1CB08
MADRITICSTCAEGEGRALAASLRTRIAELGLATEVTEIDCMIVCGQPVTVSVRAEGKAAYLFSGVDPATQVADLAAFAALYEATPDGIIEDARPAGELRFKLIGRIPA